MNRVSKLDRMRPPPAYRDPMSGLLQISTVRDAHSVAIALSGELDLASAGEVDAAIRNMEATDIGRIVVDLSQVGFIDSAGLSVLLAAKNRSNGRFKVRRSNNAAVTRLLELTETTEILCC